MIEWPWLIPAFILGGMFGFMMFCILAVNKDDPYEHEKDEMM